MDLKGNEEESAVELALFPDKALDIIDWFSRPPILFPKTPFEKNDMSLLFAANS